MTQADSLNIPQPPLLDFSPGRRGIPITADAVLKTLTLSAACVVLLMLLSLIFVLGRSAMPAIRQFGGSFLTTSEWRPTRTAARAPDGKLLRGADGKIVMLEPTYGAAAVIYGTTVSSLVALVLAIPPSLAAAIFLVRLAPGKIGAAVAFLIEFLAAIPSLAYGLWGLFVLRPLLRDHVEPFLLNTLGNTPGLSWLFHDAAGSPYSATGGDILAGGLILAIMILPIITAVSRDVLRAVPRAQIEGSVALGATWWQSCAEMLKYSRSGLFGAIMLGLARAAGETMAVAMVIGITTQIKISPLAPAQTMSTLLAVSFGEVNDVLERSSLVYVALILLLMSLAFNIVARYLVVGKDSRTAAAH